MIVLYVGRRGSGKTTTMVKDAYQFKTRGYDIYTNMNSLTFSDVVLHDDEILSLLDREDSNYVLVLDEIQTFINSRRSARKQNVEFTYFIQQIRKRGVVILACTQFSRRVDIAFREHLDIIVFPEFKHEYGVVRARYEDNTFLEGFDYKTNRLPYREIVYDPSPVFALFDTNEVIEPVKTRSKTK